jgi:hypothetical protein
MAAAENLGGVGLANCNPYVGPRSFRLGEKDYFHGRQTETRELINLLTAERVIVLHSPAGAGKTSLIQAGLIPALASTFDILPVIRVGRPSAIAGVASEVNRYVISALLSIDPERSDTRVAKAGSDFFNLKGVTLEAGLRRRRRAADGGRPELLLFDQFEEVLTLDTADIAAKKDLFLQLGAVLGRDRVYEAAARGSLLPRWALIAVRDEYLGALERYLRILPFGRVINYRLDLLEVEEAVKAVRLPAEATGMTFPEPLARTLVDNLRRIGPPQEVKSPAFEALGSTVPVGVLGPYVEPVQLQVVCRQLWEQLKTNHKHVVSEDDVRQYADVDTALGSYYASGVAKAVNPAATAKAAEAAEAAKPPERDPAAEATERRIRDWCEDRLISPQGFRAIVQEGVGGGEELESAEVKELVDSYLVRRDRLRGLTWLELSHDRLIQPIQRNNERWREEHLERFQVRGRRWHREGRPRRLLLSGLELVQATERASLQSKWVNETDRQYLAASHEAATAGDRFRGVLYRWWAYLATAACLVLVVLVAIAITQRIRADQQAHLRELEAAKARESLKAIKSAISSPTRPAEGNRSLLDRVGQLTEFASRQRLRPLQPGTSISDDGIERVGTICCLVRDRGGSKVYLLAADHSILGPRPTVGSPVVQPAVLDGGDPRADSVARVARWVPIQTGPETVNRVAGAIAELVPGVEWEGGVLGSGRIRGTAEPKLGQKVFLVARTSALNRGKVSAFDVTVSIQLENGRALFEGLIVVEGEAAQFSQAGDSGAPVLTEEGDLLGFVFAGNREVTYVMPIQPVLEALNVELVR